MKIAVIGAGVVGVTTAYVLAKRGHEITVFDREPGVAMESSFANGGQLSYGFASPIGSPGLVNKLPTIMRGADPAFRLPSVMSVDFIHWSLRFLYQCSPAAFAENARVLGDLARRSGRAFQEILNDANLTFGHREAGKLVLFASLADAEAAMRSRIGDDGKSDCRVLDWSECKALEPALESYRGANGGGLWVPGDEVGDAAQFSLDLAEHAKRVLGAVFEFNTDVRRIGTGGSGVNSVVLANGETRACDAVVLCTGVAGKRLLQQLNIRLPIYPVTGYSLTGPAGASVPTTAVTDAAHKIVFSRIGERVRIAGFADFGVASEERRRQRVQDLINAARRLMPNLIDYAKIQSTWIGARPATPNSRPILGMSAVPGLYLNMGHGMFGWTLSAGAAQQLAGVIGSAHQWSKAA